jgi:hypothetical protein
MRETHLPEPPRKSREKDAKAARLAEALRANLARRKAQQRARATETPAPKNAD